MHDPSFTFLKELLETPSPSGFERPIQDVVRNWVRPFADEVRTDRHGNVIAIRNPGGQPRVMLAGHCDQIGLMVQHVLAIHQVKAANTQCRYVAIDRSRTAGDPQQDVRGHVVAQRDGQPQLFGSNVCRLIR